MIHNKVSKFTINASHPIKFIHKKTRITYSQVSNKRANGIKEQGGKFSLISDERTGWNKRT